MTFHVPPMSRKMYWPWLLRMTVEPSLPLAVALNLTIPTADTGLFALSKSTWTFSEAWFDPAPVLTKVIEEYVLPAEGIIDLEPMIRDAVVLAMPFSPLCRPDCLGLCARCGGDRNLGECSCPPEVDERLAALAMIEFPDDLQAGDDAGDDPPDIHPDQN